MEDRDALWSEILVAERFLVSAIHASALSKASDVLDKLCLKSAENRRILLAGDDDDELRDLVEAAGMVLIQAASELGRLGSLFNILENHFENLEFIPYYLIVPAICQQVTSQLHDPAERVLRIYLDGFSSANGSCTKTFRNSSIFLPESVYANLCEIFSVHLLALKDTKLARSWTEKACLTQSRRQTIADKLSPSADAKVEAGFPAEEDTAAAKRSTPTSIQQAPLGRLGLGYWAKLLIEVFRTYWIPGISLQSAFLGKGLATIIVVYALMRGRHIIRRTLSNLLIGAGSGLKDFWELAFGLQINPLAAVTSAGH